MTENGHASSTNQPEQGREWRGNQTQGNGDDEQTRVQLRRRGAESANFEIAAVQASDEPHADNNEDDVEEQEPVGEESVQAQHAKDDGVVAGEVAEVVVDTRLHLTEVGRLGESLEVEELGDGSQVGESSGQGTRSEAREPVSKVQTRRQGVNGNLDTSHCDLIGVV